MIPPKNFENDELTKQEILSSSPSFSSSESSELSEHSLSNPSEDEKYMLDSNNNKQTENLHNNNNNNNTNINNNDNNENNKNNNDNLNKEVRIGYTIDVDKMIEKISREKSILMSEREIEAICNMSRQIFSQESMLVKIRPPIKIIGDIHGQYDDLLSLFAKAGNPSETSYLFLGDYVDRGNFSVHVILLLLLYKIKYPKTFWMLRGNHECASINRIYGFFDECKRRFLNGIRVWKSFCDCFNHLPVAAIIDQKILCMHGGLSPNLESFDQIEKLKRPTDVPDSGLLCDLLWSDPNPNAHGWQENDRGVSYTFGAQVVHEFLKTHDLELICRAHQVVEDGYEFFASRSLVTIFSAPNYCGEFENSAAVMNCDETLFCTFTIHRPVYRNKRVKYYS